MQLYDRLPNIPTQYVVGQTNVVDRFSTTVIGATVALTSVGRLRLPAGVMNQFLQRILCTAFLTLNSAGNMQVQVLFDATPIFTVTFTPANAFAMTIMEVFIGTTNISAAGDAVFFCRLKAANNAAAGVAGQEFVSGQQITGSINWGAEHTIDVQIAKNVVGDFAAGFYGIAEVI